MSNFSLFGFVGNPVDQAAYDMNILSEIEKDDKELELRKLYGSEILDEEDADAE